MLIAITALATLFVVGVITATAAGTTRMGGFGYPTWEPNCAGSIVALLSGLALASIGMAYLGKWLL